MAIDAVETSGFPRPIKDVGYVTITPALGSNLELTSKIWSAYTEHSKALVLETFATGTVPEALTPLIRDYVDKGGSVFLLSNNPGDEKGITKLAYEANMGAVGAGAVPLRDVNVNNKLTVLEAVQDAIEQGMHGKNLDQAVIEKFGSPISEPSSF